MTKSEFLEGLGKRLSGFPKSDLKERLDFYSEIIDDKIEEGLSEEKAVESLGTLDGVVSKIIAETSFVKIAKEKIKPQRALKAWEITLLAVGSPVWTLLLVSAFAVVFSLYASVWAIIASLWVSLGAISISSVFGIVVWPFIDTLMSGFIIFGASLFLLGFSVFLFFGCKAATKWTILLTKNIFTSIKCTILNVKGGEKNEKLN